jgi:hypothetical protein
MALVVETRGKKRNKCATGYENFAFEAFYMFFQQLSRELSPINLSEAIFCLQERLLRGN